MQECRCRNNVGIIYDLPTFLPFQPHLTTAQTIEITALNGEQSEKMFLSYMLLNKVDQMNEDLQKIKSAYNANQRNASRQTLSRSLPKEQLETLAYIEARNRLYQEKNDKKIDEEKTLGEQLAELHKKEQKETALTVVRAVFFYPFSERTVSA